MARRKAAPKKATKQDKVAEAVTAPAESIYIGQSDKDDCCYDLFHNYGSLKFYFDDNDKGLTPDRQ